jgi:hypothetical protein
MLASRRFLTPSTCASARGATHSLLMPTSINKREIMAKAARHKKNSWYKTVGWMEGVAALVG